MDNFLCGYRRQRNMLMMAFSLADTVKEKQNFNCWIYEVIREEGKRAVDKLVIKKARLDQTDEINEIVSKTIKEIYPKYYSNEVVEFFLALHNRDTIHNDILEDNTYVIGYGTTSFGA